MPTAGAALSTMLSATLTRPPVSMLAPAPAVGAGLESRKCHHENKRVSRQSRGSWKDAVHSDSRCAWLGITDGLTLHHLDVLYQREHDHCGYRDSLYPIPDQRHFLGRQYVEEIETETTKQPAKVNRVL